ncbi:sensor histidine kinase [Acidaminobacter sp. JC074]|uniref:sensor histidine kinase n=1 Tax=Acidaminobacter sp. JC074 TaxID=2530199 RepID=UPI001F0E95B7|nr:sensor histidine kinase [Acidaminobacter sp. JC074]MCH4886193.1 sensor histidine kinase [Acidaminobacter sp. JC074]
MGFYKKLNIKNKLLFMFVFQMVLPVIILGFFLLRNVESNMKSQALTLSQDMLKVLELRITDFTSGIKSVSQDLLYDLEVYDVLNDDQSDKFIYYHNVNNLKNVLRTLTLSNDGIQAITIYDKRGSNHTYDMSSGRLNNLKDIPYDILLEKSRQAEGRPIWHVDYEGTNANIYMSRIINDIDTFNEVGLLVIRVDFMPMKNDYENLSSDIFQSIALLENDGQIIFTTENSPIHSESVNYDESTGVLYEDDSKERIISYRKVDNPNWVIVTAISKKVLLRDVTKFTQYAFMIFIPMAVLLSFFTIFEGMHMVEAINQIVSGMKDVSKGKKHVNIQVDRGDELGFLAESFNDMSTELKNLVENVKTEQITRKEVEMKALQAQINPHFLYNTLETINWHAQLKGAPEISEMVTALSSIMEATIGRDNKLISLRDEMKYIENYISIMKYRYEGRLTFKRDIDPQILSIKIPRLILQPIVENAINHGIGKTKKVGEINISAFRKEEDIVIEICDNGKGMTVDTLKEVYQRIGDKQDGSSIGLQNVDKRLKLFYGEDYGITILSEEDVYTKVVVIIPEKKLTQGDNYYV